MLTCGDAGALCSDAPHATDEPSTLLKCRARVAHLPEGVSPQQAAREVRHQSGSGEAIHTGEEADAGRGPWRVRVARQMPPPGESEVLGTGIGECRRWAGKSAGDKYGKALGIGRRTCTEKYRGRGRGTGAEDGDVWLKR